MNRSIWCVAWKCIPPVWVCSFCVVDDDNDNDNAPVKVHPSACVLIATLQNDSRKHFKPLEKVLCVRPPQADASICSVDCGRRRKVAYTACLSDKLKVIHH